MSKESYIRGFCKIAQTLGGEKAMPDAGGGLTAKKDPKYNTNGKAIPAASFKQEYDGLVPSLTFKRVNDKNISQNITTPQEAVEAYDRAAKLIDKGWGPRTGMSRGESDAYLRAFMESVSEALYRNSEWLTRDRDGSLKVSAPPTFGFVQEYNWPSNFAKTFNDLMYSKTNTVENSAIMDIARGRPRSQNMIAKTNQQMKR